jgi:serine/threonine-protein kinase
LADRYVIERELGHGGMATVYLAHDPRHDRPVALKVLHPDLAATIGPERFLREIKLTARLDHPHILTVLDSGETIGQLWYTMPYVEGESLRDRLRREPQLPVGDAVATAREVADALHYAHSHGVVHRDIKPENILLSGGHARVADFGIARAVSESGAERLTGTGLSLGTPAYMSPEQASGSQELDGRSDIYSLGCVLHEMLAGEPPFAGSTPQAVIGKRFVEAPAPLHRLRAAVPESLGEVVLRALAREPVDRFPSAAEFAQALANSSSTAPLRSPPPAATKRALTPPPEEPRWRLPAGVALLLIVLVLGFSVLLVWQRWGVEGVNGTDPQLLAVLPFENLGDSADAYFADGLSDGVRGKLAGVSRLRVIAGASSAEYRGTPKSPQDIARELGARYLLVGKVHLERGTGEQPRLRVSPELVEVQGHGTPTTRWQQTFEASLPGVFLVQTDIARSVAEVLGLAIGPTEAVRLAEIPTRNLAAYDAYLRGEQVSGGVANAEPMGLRRALPYYEQAIALDSTFIQAWARLSLGHSLLYLNGTPTRAVAEVARRAAQRALALGPNRAEGRLALGNYYAYVMKEDRRALEQYAAGLRLAPGNADLLTHSAFAEQNVGRWEPALGHFKEAQALDPHMVTSSIGLARALLWLRRYPEALEAVDHRLARFPADLTLLLTKAMVSLAQGDLAGARAVLHAAPREIEPAVLAAYVGFAWDLVWLLDDQQQHLLLRLSPAAFGNDVFGWAVCLAQAHAHRGDTVKARIYADSARGVAEEQLREVDDAGRRVLYGLMLAYLGRKEEAVREGLRGVALEPLSKSSNAAYFQHQLARIYLLLGKRDLALDQLEPLLKVPYYLSPGWLKIDPTFASLRGHPRFQRLVQGKT